MPRLDDEVAQFVALAQDGQRTASAEKLHELAHRLLDQEDDRLNDHDLQMVVSVSLKERFFEETGFFLESMNVANRLSYKNQLDVAQVSIELGRHSSGIALLDALAVRFAEKPALFAEAKGIAGRAHKDLFLSALKGNRNAAKFHLEKSLRSYDDGRAGAPEKRNWLIGNLLAISTRAQIEGIDTSGLIN